MPRPNWHLLPDPETQERSFSILSVDDHLTEPADLFASRFPARLRDKAPQAVRHRGRLRGLESTKTGSTRTTA